MTTSVRFLDRRSPLSPAILVFQGAWIENVILQMHVSMECAAEVFNRRNEIVRNVTPDPMAELAHRPQLLMETFMLDQFSEYELAEPSIVHAGRITLVDSREEIEIFVRRVNCHTLGEARQENSDPADFLQQRKPGRAQLEDGSQRRESPD